MWKAKKPASSDSSALATEGGETLWPEAVGNGEMLRSMLEMSQHDPAEFRLVLDILIHRIHWVREINFEAKGVDASPSALFGSGDSKEIPVGPLSGGGTVWVLSPGITTSVHSNGTGAQYPVELHCPPLSLICFHSIKLGKTISDLQSHWNAIKAEYSHKATSVEPVDLLPGDYEIWQEVLYVKGAARCVN